MVDPIVIARERLAKAEAKLLKQEKAVESTRLEVADLRTAVRVMAEITGESLDEKQQATAMPSRSRRILDLLPEGEQNGVAPSQIFPDFLRDSGDDITADTFRTSIWRMKNGIYLFSSGQPSWMVRSADGKYWKERISKEKASDAETSEASHNRVGLADGSQGRGSHHDPEGSIPSSSTFDPDSFDAALDDDVPF